MRTGTFLLFFLVSIVAAGQVQTQSLYSRAQLEARRKEIIEQIRETEEQLDAIKKDKNATMTQLKALQNKLAQRQNLISNINDELEDIDMSIRSSSKEVGSLKQKLEQLKVRYAQSIRYAYETRSSYDMLAFLFSAADFNDAVRRMKYLKRFREYRKEQVEQIRTTQAQLQHKIGALNAEKAQKEELVTAQVHQKQELLKETDQTNQVIQDLKGKEGKLMKEIEENRKINARINNAINTYIQKEMAEAEKRAEEAAKKAALAEAKTKTAVPEKTPAKEPDEVHGNVAVRAKPPRVEAPTLLLTPTDVALANNFEGNQGKLYWPVEKGYIISHFGKHPHPYAHDVIVEEPGVEIQTSENAAIRSVFDGTVSSVFSVSGSKQIVLVQHGNYFTVYNNLASVSVKKGQKVSTRQPIGVVGVNDDGLPTIDFQIWKASGKKGTVKLNPEPWLGKAH